MSLVWLFDILYPKNVLMGALFDYNPVCIAFIIFQNLATWTFAYLQLISRGQPQKFFITNSQVNPARTTHLPKKHLNPQPEAY